MTCAKLNCHNSQYCSRAAFTYTFTCTAKKWNGEECDTNANGGLDVSCHSNYCNSAGVCSYRAPDSSQDDPTDADVPNDAADAEDAHESDTTPASECVDYDYVSCKGDDKCLWFNFPGECASKPESMLDTL